MDQSRSHFPGQSFQIEMHKSNEFHCSSPTKVAVMKSTGKKINAKVEKTVHPAYVYNSN